MDSDSDNILDDDEVFPADTSSGILEWKVRLITRPEYEYCREQFPDWKIDWGSLFIYQYALECLDIFLDENTIAEYTSTSSGTIDFSDYRYSQKNGLGCDTTSLTQGTLTWYIWEDNTLFNFNTAILLNIDFFQDCIKECLIDMDIQTWYNNHPGENSHTFSMNFSDDIEFPEDDSEEPVPDDDEENMDLFYALHWCKANVTITATTIRGTSLPQVTGLKLYGDIIDLYDYKTWGTNDKVGWASRVQAAYSPTNGRTAGNIYKIYIEIDRGGLNNFFLSEDYNDYEGIYDSWIATITF